MFLYLFSFLIAAALFALDQWTKYWVSTHMALGETAPLLGNLLELNCVHNYGVAWSLFSGMRWILVTVTACIVIAVASALALRLIRRPAGVFAAFLILSGGLGNLLDRVFRGYVVDMIHFLFWPAYPTFNVADMCVVTGCVIWILYAVFMQEPAEAEAEKEKRREKTRAERQARRAALRREQHGASSVRSSADYGASDAPHADGESPETDGSGKDGEWNFNSDGGGSRYGRNAGNGGGSDFR